ncbi:LLM class flavin-dependent oxidoreductase [Haladaptatus pallidirubidus]|uniref:Glucose-6-phosphate dehydrogenase (Coenzyme-F420) n=1 Tax=Haladaptatus pallidirubidus TaxID=1008152 RepID=A0AAV3UJA1_9EURY|nr:LLM class flavin-dependent oxidoreductase [Haladaptatus pallidirubidus]
MGLEIHYNVYGCFREPRADVELAKKAVDAGFEGIWIGDHFMPWIDSRPFTHHMLPWFGTLMAEIPDVPVGTSVTCPMLRYRPPLLAQGIATLDNMYPGRFNLGVGVGEALNESHFLDGGWPSWSKRSVMLVEALDVMESLWTSDSYIFHRGNHFEYDQLKLYTRPKSDIPIHWAAWGPKSCRKAGRHADHLLTAAPAEQIEEHIIPNYRRGLEDAGREFANRDVTTEFAANVGNPDDLVAEIRERGEHVPDDTELGNPDPRSIQRVADTRLAELSDEEIRDGHNITDDPDELVADIRRLEEAGVTRVLVGSHCGDPYRTIEAFENHVFPELR